MMNELHTWPWLEHIQKTAHEEGYLLGSHLPGSTKQCQEFKMMKKGKQLKPLAIKEYFSSSKLLTTIN